MHENENEGEIKENDEEEGKLEEERIHSLEENEDEVGEGRERRKRT